MILPMLLLLLLMLHDSAGAQPCPDPFSLEYGKCVFVSTTQNHSWCSANRQCASIGGELVNSYDTIQLLVDRKISSADCNCDLWIGVTDLADERGTSKAGWQRVNGRGLFPEDSTLFGRNEPSGIANENCLRVSTGQPKISEKGCNTLFGFVCEFSESLQTAPNPTVGTWKVVDFKRAEFNSYYCFTDVLNVSSAVKCTAAAMRAGSSSRHVLYNSKLRTCRLLLFTDAQVEAEIERSPDFIKFQMN